MGLKITPKTYGIDETVYVPLQLIFLHGHDLANYKRTRLMPRNGAFIEDAVIPVGCTEEELHASLLERLSDLEAYRAATRGVPPRAGTLGEVFTELQDGHIVRSHVVDILGIRRMFVVVKGWSGVAPPRDARHMTS